MPTSCGTTGSARSIPTSTRTARFTRAINGRTVLITGASSGIGRATALKVAAAGGIPLLVARGLEKLEALRDEIEAAGGDAYVYSADLSDMDAIDAVVARILDEHPAVDFLVNNAGRSIRRSIKLSEDRFHDFERTMQLNYFGAIKMIMALLPHMRERGFGHVVNVSLDRRADQPAALQRLRRVQGRAGLLDARRRLRGDRRRHLVHDDPHAARAHADDRARRSSTTTSRRSLPRRPATSSARRCARAQGDQHPPGTAGEVLHALAPKVMDQILHIAYNVFPDSAASKGEKAPAAAERASIEQLAMANIMKGVHW